MAHLRTKGMSPAAAKLEKIGRRDKVENEESGEGS